ncbi:AAA family ATPase [Candidatus Woesearchaeota archaeon]|nr:AAA family ATPase [Candidatus Woesearchaeota archaeon]
MSSRNAKIIGVVSIKGGVGKTTVVSNLGAALANSTGKKVLLVDGNITAPNLGLHLGIVQSQHTLHDVLYNNVPAYDAIRKTEFGFDVLPGALVPDKSQRKKINPYKLYNRLSQVRNSYDFIVIDSSPNLNEEILSTMIASDELVVVTSPDYPTLSCTMHAVKIAKERKTPIAGLVLNKIRGKKFELSVDEIEKTTGTQVISVINDDTKVLEALSKTRPASLHTPKRAFAVEYARLAAKLAGEDFTAPGLGSRLKSMFKK